MTLDQMEHLERTAFSMVVQAFTDYHQTASTVFQEETDLPQDIAEDVTREAIESMGLSGVGDRLYGKVDYKKAIYVFLPEARAVALMLDAKAEKGNGSATLQMSQISMRVRMRRAGLVVDEPGHLEQEIVRNKRTFYVVTVIAKFLYTDKATRTLERIILACIPNGKLQDRYNPTPTDTIWRAGRDAPTRGEDFRVRLVYEALRAKAAWRVCALEL